MAEITKDNVKMMASQTLDDTDEGGGQMTATEVVNGVVNNLFPDISRIDRVYGRVSLRKVFLAINTNTRATYYGAHMVLTEQAKDPLVSICFFTTKDWFDERDNAKSRIESYLVLGPIYTAALWGPHPSGTKILNLHTQVDWEAPIVGDVLVLKTSKNLAGASISTVSQYVRVVDVNSEVREFVEVRGTTSVTFKKQIITLTISNPLAYDFRGTEVTEASTYTGLDSQIYTTVVADASKYYGVTTLKEPASAGDLQFVASSIKTALVPSAQSETAVVDHTAGRTVNPIIQVQPSETPISKAYSFTISNGAKLILGEPIISGTLSIPSYNIFDDGQGNVIQNTTVIGSIFYDTGTVNWGSTATIGYVTTTVSYVPAIVASKISHSAGIPIDITNRGFVYTFSCNPLPVKGTIRIEYKVSGKWYSMWDQGDGIIKGSDSAIGSAVANLTTGSITMSLGSMPDIDSMILVYWADSKDYFDVSGDTVGFYYEIELQDMGIVNGTFVMSWIQDSVTYTVTDSNGDLLLNGSTVVGSINYTEGIALLDSLTITPPGNQNFNIDYEYRPIFTKTVASTGGASAQVITLDNTAPIVQRTIVVEHTSAFQAYLQSVLMNTLYQGMKYCTFKYIDSGSGFAIANLVLSSYNAGATLTITANRYTNGVSNDYIIPSN